MLHSLSWFAAPSARACLLPCAGFYASSIPCRYFRLAKKLKNRFSPAKLAPVARFCALQGPIMRPRVRKTDFRAAILSGVKDGFCFRRPVSMVWTCRGGGGGDPSAAATCRGGRTCLVSLAVIHRLPRRAAGVRRDAARGCSPYRRRSGPAWSGRPRKMAPCGIIAAGDRCGFPPGRAGSFGASSPGALRPAAIRCAGAGSAPGVGVALALAPAGCARVFLLPGRVARRPSSLGRTHAILDPSPRVLSGRPARPARFRAAPLASAPNRVVLGVRPVLAAVLGGSWARPRRPLHVRSSGRAGRP